MDYGTDRSGNRLLLPKCSKCRSTIYPDERAYNNVRESESVYARHWKWLCHRCYTIVVR